MKKVIKTLWKCPQFVYVAILLKFYTRRFRNYDVIEKDAIRMAKEYGMEYKDIWTMAKLFLRYSSCFRDVFYWRCRYKCHLLKWLYKRYPCLFLDLNMQAEGGAFFFHHPFSTYINAAFVGYGCTFRNNTTIGNKTINGILYHPYLGGGNDFGVSSLVVGNVKIGAGATIGAGAVVVKNVTENTAVVGNPAHEIKKNGLI